ncbi:MAG: chalcone isomerase family protein [Gammaproteobacteria bacterium]
MRKLLVAMFLFAVGGWAGAQGATLAGVTLPDSAQVGGQTLVLNGIALRTKTWFRVKVYVGGLYLPEKADTAAAVLAKTGPDRIEMNMIYAASPRQFKDAWDEGFKDNNPNLSPALQAEIDKFVGWFGKAKQGDVITMDYVPGQGTKMHWNGELKGTIEGAEFHTALLNAFLGPKLPQDFRNGLLGVNKS